MKVERRPEITVWKNDTLPDFVELNFKSGFIYISGNARSLDDLKEMVEAAFEEATHDEPAAAEDSDDLLSMAVRP